NPGKRPIASTRYVTAKMRTGASIQHAAAIIKYMKACIAFILALSSIGFAQKRDAAFAALADRFFDECYFKFDPVAGTQAGFHQYDPLLPSGSRTEIEQQIAALKKFAGEFESFGAQGLSPSVAADRELVIAQIRGSLLSLEEIRFWEKNPDIYSSG